MACLSWLNLLPKLMLRPPKLKKTLSPNLNFLNCNKKLEKLHYSKTLHAFVAPTLEKEHQVYVQVSIKETFSHTNLHLLILAKKMPIYSNTTNNRLSNPSHSITYADTGANQTVKSLMCVSSTLNMQQHFTTVWLNMQHFTHHKHSPQSEDDLNVPPL